ncbi:MAG TPA: hypothetical protein VKE96_21760, partial [Vicinamibacterales bacterium]|nr:hypothetical protein [Vicinamibacterales bacterium]
MTLRGLLVCACLTVSATGATAQDQPPEQIEPDRPDVTNGTHIVDIGLLQIEIGGLYTRASANERDGATP